MSAWRRKAIEMFPELRDEFAAPDATIYTVFFELLARHKEADEMPEDDLVRIYGFAEWCYRQGGWLSNAAAVSFYEHCGEMEHVREEFIRRVPHGIYQDVRPLFVGRLAERHVAALDAAFERKAMRSAQGSRGQSSVVPVPTDHTPFLIDGNPVILYMSIDDRSQQPGQLPAWVHGYAICGRADGGYYLFTCNDQWEGVFDSWHQSVADAKSQAEFELGRPGTTWLRPPHASGEIPS